MKPRVVKINNKVRILHLYRNYYLELITNTQVFRKLVIITKITSNP